jgi:hypothetical protein
LPACFDLPGSCRLGATVELGHQKNFLPIPVAQGAPHALFAFAIVVVPAIVHEGDAVVDRSANDADTLLRVGLYPDVKAAQTNRRDSLAGLAQDPVDHAAACFLRFAAPDCARCHQPRHHRSQSFSPVHGHTPSPYGG